MNLIDFVVTKIIREKRGYMYELYRITREEAEQEKQGFWKEHLFSKGLEQVIEIEDMGSREVVTRYIDLDKGEKPYYIGYKGMH